MAKTADIKTRAPRGAKAVSHAFFDALGSVPEASRAAVEKAALAMIRDQIKTVREKAKAAKAKAKAAAKAGPGLKSAKAPAKGIVAKAKKALGDGVHAISHAMSENPAEAAPPPAKKRRRSGKASAEPSAT